MPLPLTAAQKETFLRACTHERIFGSKMSAALQAYGPDDPRARFFLLPAPGGDHAALYLAGDVLALSAPPGTDMAPVSALIRREGVHEVDAPLPLCEALQGLLGGTLESSYYMVYRGGDIRGDFSDLTAGDLHTVFDVLQRSHEYYRTHLTFDTWSEDLKRRLDLGLMELYQLERDGQVVGTGSIASEDAECGVPAAVAVVPEWRHRGLGAHISRFLTGRVLEKGKTPRLISGYDAVAALYTQVGYESYGRWGELYL